jgi:citrate lyase subunit beta-like protein
MLTQVSTDFKNLDVLRVECQEGSSFGFTGKQAIHPSQIPIIHDAFSPSRETIEHAARLIRQYCAESETGKRGAWEFEGKMVDMPVIKKAKHILTLAVNLNVEKDIAKPVLDMMREQDKGEDSSEAI